MRGYAAIGLDNPKTPANMCKRGFVRPNDKGARPPMIDYKQLAHDIAAPYAVEHQPTIEDGRCTVDVHVHYMVRRESDAAHDWRHAEIEIESIEINGVHTKPDGLEAEFLAELERWAKDHEGIR